MADGLTGVFGTQQANTTPKDPAPSHASNKPATHYSECTLRHSPWFALSLRCCWRAIAESSRGPAAGDLDTRLDVCEIFISLRPLSPLALFHARIPHRLCWASARCGRVTRGTHITASDVTSRSVDRVTCRVSPSRQLRAIRFRTGSNVVPHRPSFHGPIRRELHALSPRIVSQFLRLCSSPLYDIFPRSRRWF